VKLSQGARLMLRGHAARTWLMLSDAIISHQADAARTWLDTNRSHGDDVLGYGTD
jgi:hypothetical protein